MIEGGRDGGHNRTPADRGDGACLAVILAACASRQFPLVLKGGDLVEAVAVTVDDRTGLVVNVGIPDPEGAGWRDGVSNPPGHADQLLVTWLGGMCDHRTTLTFEPTGSGFRIREQTERADACLLAGISRTVIVQLAAPVAAERVELVPALALGADE